MNYLPPIRSGFVDSKCPKCGQSRFSKGRIHKHKCRKEINDKRKHA